MATYSIQEIYDAARAAGFTPDQATTWTAIALAESGGKTDALNDHGEHSMGLWQINVASNVRTNQWGNLDDPVLNARAAYEVSLHGRDMRPWTTTHAFNKGTAHDYRNYLAEVEARTGAHGDWRGVSGYGAPMLSPLPDGYAAGEHPPATEAGQGDSVATDTVTVNQTAGLTDQGSQIDTDHDGLTDAYEKWIGTNPVLADTLADGLPDGPEVALGTDPNVTPVPAPAAPHTESTADRFVQAAVDQRGDRYIYGAETKMSDPNPKAFDCSELTQWAAHQAGVTIPDGAEWQYLDLKQKHSLISVDEALHTKGALLFSFSFEPTSSGPRPSHAHVAISLGNGRTIEARGRAYGVDEFSAKNRFNYAGVIPGVSTADVAPGEPGHPAEVVAAHAAYDQIDHGLAPDQWTHAGPDSLTDAFERLAGMDVTRAYAAGDSLTAAYDTLVSHVGPLPGDIDHGGVSDAVAVDRGTDPGHLAGVAAPSDVGPNAENLRSAVIDSDHDGLSDRYEGLAHLNPYLVDTDGDGLSDPWEVAIGTDATKMDTDGDGLTDKLELELGRDPTRLGSGVGGTGLGGGLGSDEGPGLGNDLTAPAAEPHPPPLPEHP